VLTVGIYAAWAKVRKRRYFWGSTQLGGRAFDYTGNPVAILKGNLILGAGAVLYYVASRAQPLLGVASLFAFGLVYPWLFQRSMTYNAWNTRHRNIRFGFHGSVGESYALNLGWPLLAPLTLGGLYPWIHFRLKRYQIGYLSFGTSRLDFDGTPGPFYATFFKAFGIAVAGFVAGFACIMGGIAGGGRAPEFGLATWVGFAVIYVTMILAFGVYYATRVTNEVLNHTALPRVLRLRSTQRVREVLALEASNLLAVVCTLGLLAPWAAVRRARYRWSHIEARFSGPIEGVTAAMAPEPGALGSVAADNLDIDISL